MGSMEDGRYSMEGPPKTSSSVAGRYLLPDMAEEKSEPEAKGDEEAYGQEIERARRDYEYLVA